MDPGFIQAPLGVLVLAALVGWIGVAVIVRTVSAVRPPGESSQPSAPPARARVLAAASLTVLLFAVPPAANAVSRKVLDGRVRSCPDMRSAAAGSSQATLRILAEACGQRGDEAASERVGDIRLDVYRGKRNADVQVVGSDVRSFVAHIAGVLGLPPVRRITVSPVSMPGDVRGMTGPGYLLIDAAEFVSLRECERFRSTADRRLLRHLGRRSRARPSVVPGYCSHGPSKRSGRLGGDRLLPCMGLVASRLRRTRRRGSQVRAS